MAPMHFLRLSVALALLCVMALYAGRGYASDAGTLSAAAISVESDPRTLHIRALIAGTLDIGVEPDSLFDVPLQDERAIRTETIRLRALLSALKTPASAPSSTQASEAFQNTSTAEQALAPGAEPGAWQQRVELDETRLAFYSLPTQRRAELLRVHAERQKAEPITLPRLSEPHEQTPEQTQALAAAKAARAEAEKLVNDELTRLTALEAQINAIRRVLLDKRAELNLRKDLVFGWQRRVRDAKSAEALNADATYDGLYRQLGSSRDELMSALDELDEASQIPTIGPDILAGIPPDISTEAAQERRLTVQRLIAQGQQEEDQLRQERCSVLLEEITTLNRERLGLLPHLSADKREALTGLTQASWEQALAEVKHLSLVLRYHRHVARGWVSIVRSGDTGAVSPWTAARFFVPLLGAILVFLWGRKRTHSLLRLADLRLAAADRSHHLTTQSPARLFIRVMLAIHRPLEWLLLWAVIYEVLPRNTRELLEVQLLTSVVMWLLVGTLAVNLINVLASGRSDVLAKPGDAESELRLRSLRFVAGTIVAFGLALILCARLVGEGTIYSWVSSAAWFAIVPVFLVLVRWWRGTVFERLDKIRKRTPLQTWLLANRSGWKSFLAAMVGALQLFTTGTLKVTISWISGFDVARRVHAYLFKREIERLKEGLSQLEPLSPATLSLLHPERPVSVWVPCPADDVLDALQRRYSTERGGVVAIHGPRGMGKTSLLRKLTLHAGNGACLVDCDHHTTLADIRRAAARVTEDENAANGRIVMLDEAQTLIQSRIGGLSHFDDVIAWMRSRGDKITWVIAFDSALWPLLQRARDSRPLFDECHRLAPWQETQIGELLEQRCQAANISPVYDDLLEKLPPGADEIDKQEALDVKRAGYQRMLWDHVGGNPGLALEAWRASLARDARGNVRVRSLQTPDASVLESLPDASLFVLRAVLQLAPAAVATVAEATRLRPDEVLVDFRYGKSHGYFEESEGRVRIAWAWLGAVTRLLERRRLLVVV